MADAVVKPAFVSPAAVGYATQVQGPDWNAAQLFSGGTTGDLLTRDPASATGASWLTPSVGPAAAGTLTGATLAPNVLASSLTSHGTLTGLAVAGAAPLFTRDALAVVSTDGLVLQNTVPATVGVPVQQGPRLRLSGHVLSTTGNVDNADDWRIEGLPISGAVPSSQLRLSWSPNGGAYVDKLTINSAGNLVVTGSITGAGNITGTGNLTAGAGNVIQWTGLTQLHAPADGQFNIRNSGNSAGIGLNVATDAVLKVRTRAQTGDASLTALNITASSAIVNRTKAGTPVDGDVTSPADGMCMVDTTASKIWVRIGGAWKGVAVA